MLKGGGWAYLKGFRENSKQLSSEKFWIVKEIISFWERLTWTQWNLSWMVENIIWIIIITVLNVTIIIRLAWLKTSSTSSESESSSPSSLNVIKIICLACLNTSSESSESSILQHSLIRLRLIALIIATVTMAMILKRHQWFSDELSWWFITMRAMCVQTTNTVQVVWAPMHSVIFLPKLLTQSYE